MSSIPAAPSLTDYAAEPERDLSWIEARDPIALFDDWLAPQRRAWGISNEVILRRLMDAKRLPKAQYAAYRQWWATRELPPKTGGSREYRNREPKHIFGDGYVRTVLDALNSRRISLTKASTYLDNLKISDLHKLEQHYAGI